MLQRAPGGVITEVTKTVDCHGNEFYIDVRVGIIIIIIFFFFFFFFYYYYYEES